jgi:hypothetical protein
MHTRRHLLVALGATATAGCTGALGSGDDDGGDGGETSGRVRLEELSVQNDHAAARDVQVAVEIDGDTSTRTNSRATAAGGRSTASGARRRPTAYTRVLTAATCGPHTSRGASRRTPSASGRCCASVRAGS